MFNGKYFVPQCHWNFNELIVIFLTRKKFQTLKVKLSVNALVSNLLWLGI